MPLVKVNLLKGRSDEEKESIAASIQTALISTLKVPDADRYQVFNEYDGESFRHTSGYLGMTYTDQLLIIEITFLEGRDDEVKKSLLAEINRNLVAAGVVGEDDVIVLGDDGKVVEGGFRPELEQTLQNLSNVLADAGVTREQVIKVNVYLADLADWSALNGPYAEFFGSSLPARTAFATSALPFGARVEIEAWAVVEETR